VTTVILQAKVAPSMWKFGADPGLFSGKVHYFKGGDEQQSKPEKVIFSQQC